MNVFALAEAGSPGATIPIVDPLSYLPKFDKDINVRIETQMSFCDFNWADIVYIHRPIKEFHLDIIRACNKAGKKVVLLIDDDLLTVPIDHPRYFFYKDPILKNRIKICCELADHIVFSNKEIVNSFSFVKNYSVIHCAYPDELINSIGESEVRNKVAYFRGSPTHRKSLLEYSDAIAECGNSHLDWTFVFIGDHPWYVLEKLKNPWYVVSDFMQPTALWEYLKKLKPKINFCPRTENQFTRSRSDMAYMDAMLCGAITLGPDWDLWRHSGVINYKDKEDFIIKFNSMMEDSFSYSWIHGRNFMKENRSYSYSAEKHLSVIRSLKQYKE